MSAAPSGAADVGRLRHIETQQLVRDVATFCRFYAGGVPAALATPHGWFCALLDEAPRLAALEKRDQIDVHYTKDARWLSERLTAISQQGLVSEYVDDAEAEKNWDMVGKLMGR